MRTFLILGLCLAVHSASSATLSEPLSVQEALKKHLLIRAVQPIYPYEARHAWISGHGIFDLRFDHATGHLREIHVVQSTGSPMLDGRSVGALKLWVAKPGALDVIRVPINFELKHSLPIAGTMQRLPNGEIGVETAFSLDRHNQ